MVCKRDATNNLLYMPPCSDKTGKLWPWISIKENKLWIRSKESLRCFNLWHLWIYLQVNSLQKRHRRRLSIKSSLFKRVVSVMNHGKRFHLLQHHPQSNKDRKLALRQLWIKGCITTNTITKFFLPLSHLKSTSCVVLFCKFKICCLLVLTSFGCCPSLFLLLQPP